MKYLLKVELDGDRKPVFIEHVNVNTGEVFYFARGYDGFIDTVSLEWVLENVPAKFVLFRAINQFYQSYEEVAEILPMSVVAQKYDLLIIWKEFQQLEQLFIGSVIDNVHFAESKAFGGNPTKDVVGSIRRLLSE